MGNDAEVQSVNALEVLGLHVKHSETLRDGGRGNRSPCPTSYVWPIAHDEVCCLAEVSWSHEGGRRRKPIEGGRPSRGKPPVRPDAAPLRRSVDDPLTRPADGPPAATT